MLIAVEKIYCVIYYDLRHTFIPHAQTASLIPSAYLAYCSSSFADICSHPFRPYSPSNLAFPDFL